MGCDEWKLGVSKTDVFLDLMTECQEEIGVGFDSQFFLIAKESSLA